MERRKTRRLFTWAAASSEWTPSTDDSPNTRYGPYRGRSTVGEDRPENKARKHPFWFKGIDATEILHSSKRSSREGDVVKRDQSEAHGRLQSSPPEMNAVPEETMKERRTKKVTFSLNSQLSEGGDYSQSLASQEMFLTQRDPQPQNSGGSYPVDGSQGNFCPSPKEDTSNLRVRNIVKDKMSGNNVAKKTSLDEIVAFSCNSQSSEVDDYVESLATQELFLTQMDPLRLNSGGSFPANGSQSNFSSSSREDVRNVLVRKMLKGKMRRLKSQDTSSKHQCNLSNPFRSAHAYKKKRYVCQLFPSEKQRVCKTKLNSYMQQRQSRCQSSQESLPRGPMSPKDHTESQSRGDVLEDENDSIMLTQPFSPLQSFGGDEGRLPKRIIFQNGESYMSDEDLMEEIPSSATFEVDPQRDGKELMVGDMDRSLGNEQPLCDQEMVDSIFPSFRGDGVAWSKKGGHFSDHQITPRNDLFTAEVETKNSKVVCSELKESHEHVSDRIEVLSCSDNDDDGEADEAIVVEEEEQPRNFENMSDGETAVSSPQNTAKSRKLHDNAGLHELTQGSADFVARAVRKSNWEAASAGSYLATVEESEESSDEDNEMTMKSYEEILKRKSEKISVANGRAIDDVCTITPSESEEQNEECEKDSSGDKAILRVPRESDSPAVEKQNEALLEAGGRVSESYVIQEAIVLAMETQESIGEGRATEGDVTVVQDTLDLNDVKPSSACVFTSDAGDSSNDDLLKSAVDNVLSKKVKREIEKSRQKHHSDGEGISEGSANIVPHDGDSSLETCLQADNCLLSAKGQRSVGAHSLSIRGDSSADGGSTADVLVATVAGVTSHSSTGQVDDPAANSATAAAESLHRVCHPLHISVSTQTDVTMPTEDDQLLLLVCKRLLIEYEQGIVTTSSSGSLTPDSDIARRVSAVQGEMERFGRDGLMQKVRDSSSPTEAELLLRRNRKWGKLKPSTSSLFKEASSPESEVKGLNKCWKGSSLVNGPTKGDDRNCGGDTDEVVDLDLHDRAKLRRMMNSMVKKMRKEKKVSLVNRLAEGDGSDTDEDMDLECHDRVTLKRIRKSIVKKMGKRSKKKNKRGLLSNWTSLNLPVEASLPNPEELLQLKRDKMSTRSMVKLGKRKKCKTKRRTDSNQEDGQMDKLVDGGKKTNDSELLGERYGGNFKKRKKSKSAVTRGIDDIGPNLPGRKSSGKIEKKKLSKRSSGSKKMTRGDDGDGDTWYREQTAVSEVEEVFSDSDNDDFIDYCLYPDVFAMRANHTVEVTWTGHESHIVDESFSRFFTYDRQKGCS